MKTVVEFAAAAAGCRNSTSRWPGSGACNDGWRSMSCASGFHTRAMRRFEGRKARCAAGEA